MASERGARDLTLYYFPMSYYSQRALIALAEKNIPYHKHWLVDWLTDTMEQYQPWYIRMNPQGKAPTLKHGDKVIADSVKIIDYLEENFVGDDIPMLFPPKGCDEFKLVRNFCHRVDKITIDIITFGTFYFKPNQPGVASFMSKRIIERIGKRERILMKLAEDAPSDMRKLYDDKVAESKDFFVDVKNESILKEKLREAETVLDEIDTQLASHTGTKQNWWLCTEQFTAADLFAAVFLCRISALGYGLWDKEKRPHIGPYFKRLKQRQSMQQHLRAITTVNCLKQFLPDIAPWKQAMVIGIMGAAIGLAIYVRRG